MGIYIYILNVSVPTRKRCQARRASAKEAKAARAARKKAAGSKSVSIDAGAVLEVGPNLVRVEALTTEGTELTRSFYVLGEKEAE